MSKRLSYGSYMGSILDDVEDGREILHWRVTFAACLLEANDDATRARKVMRHHWPVEFDQMQSQERHGLEVVK